MSTSPLRVALVGYGIAGSLHSLVYRLLPMMFPSLKRSAELVLIVDPSEKSRSRASNELGIPVSASINADIIERYNIEAIDCCVPTEQHAEVCRLAIEHDLAILCEKPLTGIAESSRQLVSLAEDAKKGCFSVNFNFRFVPAIQEAKRRITAGMLGELKSFRVEYHRSSNLPRWRNGQWNNQSLQRGALMDLGPHAIDMVHFLFGPIRTLSAHKLFYSTDPNETLADDAAKLQLMLEKNILGNIEVSKMTPGAANDLSIFAYGTEGTLRFSMDNPNALDIFDSATDWRKQEHYRINSSEVTLSSSIIPPETPTGILMWHAASIASFIESTVNKTAPITSFKAGLGVDLVIDAALKSLSNRSAFVSVEKW